METKEKRYAELVKRVAYSYKTNPPKPNKQGVTLSWFDECKEINLWSYWQGKGHLDAKILLVGQDWGYPDANSAVIKNIVEINSGNTIPYMTGNENTTDKHLAELFSEIGYKINENDALNSELFFTNFILGYRSKGLSGGLSRSWIEHDKKFFKELVDIIEPKTIICLGKATLCGVIESFGEHGKIGNYNRFIESNKNPFVFSMNNGNEVRIYGVAHCGAMGTLNRNGKSSGKDLSKQKLDWKRISEEMHSTK